MKNKSAILKTAIGVASLLIIQSCALTKRGEFAQQKYTKFHKGSIEVAANKATSESVVLSNENSQVPVLSTERLSINEGNQLAATINTTVSTTPSKKINTPIIKTFAESKFVKRSVLNIAKKASANFAHNKNTASYSDDATILLVILAILIPPLAVALKDGLGLSFWLDLLLTICFILPGIIYALIVVLG